MTAPDVYDVLLLVAAALFGGASVAIGWSTLRDHRVGPANQPRKRSTVALELLAWAVPTVLMVAVFAAAIVANR